MKNTVRKILVPYLVLLFFTLSHIIAGQGKGIYEESLVKTQMIERITHFIEWPGNAVMNSNNFITIGIIGRDAVSKNIENTFANQKIKNRQVKIINFSNITDIEECDILYIARNVSGKLSNVLRKIEGLPILTISDIENAASEGVIISFVVNSSVYFEINETKAKNLKFNISYKLLNFAKYVY